MPTRLEADSFDPAAALAAFEQSHPAGSFGACASFTGTMRSFNEGDTVVAMELEHYPEMTEPQLAAICADACDQYDIVDALIVHRIGRIEPGDPIVLTAVLSPHRKAAFEACRFLMEALKQRATFWKKEWLSDGRSRWVGKNTPG